MQAFIQQLDFTGRSNGLIKREGRLVNIASKCPKAMGKRHKIRSNVLKEEFRYAF